jgi:copper chaperone
VRTETLDVRGMTCGGCERRVNDAVSAIPGVVAVVAEHIGDEVEVTFDPARVDLDAIRTAIAAEGFAVA